jgi:hypothetical protein
MTRRQKRIAQLWGRGYRVTEENAEFGWIVKHPNGRTLSANLIGTGWISEDAAWDALIGFLDDPRDIEVKRSPAEDVMAAATEAAERAGTKLRGEVHQREDLSSVCHMICTVDGRKVVVWEP